MRRVVDEDQERAFRRAIFEPAVMGAVDLDEFTKAGPPLAWWMRRFALRAARLPESCRDHCRAQRFLGDRNAVAFGQFL
ncbi:MAG TPA: hypothetical protein VGG22_16765 [Candidatus Baltobacteraceae bacterium]